MKGGEREGEREDEMRGREETEMKREEERKRERERGRERKRDREEHIPFGKQSLEDDEEKVRVDIAFVNLVHDHMGDAVQQWITLQASQQNASGAEEQPGVCGSFRLQTDLVAYREPDAFRSL
jgi:desulfoferrodoxin (superoxide reductase-like protein)